MEDMKFKCRVDTTEVKETKTGDTDVTTASIKRITENEEVIKLTKMDEGMADTFKPKTEVEVILKFPQKKLTETK